MHNQKRLSRLKRESISCTTGVAGTFARRLRRRQLEVKAFVCEPYSVKPRSQAPYKPNRDGAVNEE